MVEVKDLKVKLGIFLHEHDVKPADCSQVTIDFYVGVPAIVSRERKYSFVDN